MTLRRHHVLTALAGLAALALTGPVAAAPAAVADRAANHATPALAAFDRAWAGVRDYRATVTADERTNDGKRSKHYVYDVRFLKPTFVRIDVVDGAGRGSGAVWHGGDDIVGHSGGFLSALKLSVPLTDGRAKSLRGETIATTSFGNRLATMLDTPGELSEAPAGGDATDVTLIPREPLPGGVTRVVLELSNTTHLPLVFTEDVDKTPVNVERFTDLKTNVGLSEADFH